MSTSSKCTFLKVCGVSLIVCGLINAAIGIYELITDSVSFWWTGLLGAGFLIVGVNTLFRARRLRESKS